MAFGKNVSIPAAAVAPVPVNRGGERYLRN
jgi:hypothetical protein